MTDPEKKRKIIGNLFIKIFERYAKKIKNVKFLAQGTLYPDLIESKSVTGSQTSKIKSHHNVGGLPKRMKLKLVEPLKFLFNKKVIVCRKTTERPEGIDTGHLYMCESPKELSVLFEFINKDYTVNSECPYGDGKSSKKISKLL